MLWDCVEYSWFQRLKDVLLLEVCAGWVQCAQLDNPKLNQILMCGFIWLQCSFKDAV